MFSFFKRPKKDSLLDSMNGQEIKYVTKRVTAEDGSVREEILGKTGRIVALDGEIRVMCGEMDVFRAMAVDTSYYTLLSGNGITVSGVNTLNGEKQDIIVYYTYHRK